MVKIPRRLDEFLPAAAMEKMLDVLQQPDISNKVREAIGKVGRAEGNPLDRVKDAWQQARSWLDSLTANEGGGGEYPNKLNASGQLFRPNLAGVPMSPSVAYGYAKAATNYLDNAQLHRKSELAITQIFDGRRAAWLTSTAEALRLLAGSEWASDGVVISRADAVRIPGVGDIRAMLAQGARPMIEVGAANGVSPQDWSDGLTSDKQLLVLASPNGIAAEEAETHRAKALQAAKASGAHVVELLADGCVSRELSEAIGFPDARERLASGADGVILPLNLMLGGPGGALVVGDSRFVGLLLKSAEATGVHLTSAALAAATMALQLGALDDVSEVGVVGQLLANPENLKNRARRMAVQLSGVGEVAEATETETEASLGATPWNRYRLRSWGVRVRPKTTLETLYQSMNDGAKRHGVAVEVVSEEQALLLDLRFVPPQNDHELVLAFAGDQEGQPGAEVVI